MAVIARLLAQDLQLIRSKQGPFRRFVERLALRCMDHPSLRRLLAAKIRRIDDLARLGEAPGRPRTTLCLGHGPSSADPALGSASGREPACKSLGTPGGAILFQKTNIPA